MNMDQNLASSAATVTFPAIVHPSIQHFLDKQSDLLLDLSERTAGSFHLCFPDIFRATMQRFSQRISAWDIPHLVLYATKVCRADTFLDACGEAGFGVDVASIEEMRRALSAGVPGSRLCLSGPFKQQGFIELARSSNALVAIDSLEELYEIRGLCVSSRQQRPLDLLLRWKGAGSKPSRFGMTDNELGTAIDQIREGGGVRFRGLSFHLRGYDLNERAASLAGALEKLQLYGMPEADTINIGGGYPVSYVTEQTWQAGKSEIEANGRGTGCYPAWSPISGDTSLDLILNSQSGDGTPLGRVLADRSIRLLLEPGRSALDQAAISAFRVVGIRDAPEGFSYVYLAANNLSFSERMFGCEVLYDPILLSRRPNRGSLNFHRVKIVGNTCLEDDVFSEREILLPKKPAPGDLIVYVNTAGYQMDFAETSIHGMRLPNKYSVVFQGTHAIIRGV
jgi:diaminopimelate decarboxylase